MSKDKISVIIPIYKVESYLRKCLDSVVGQTYRNLEIILIDDGSPDRCGAICDEYSELDKRIVVIHKENGGLSAARNDGIRRATGDWIAFVDSDDWCELDYYEKLIAAAGKESPDVIFAGGYYIEYPSKRKKIYTTREKCSYYEPGDIEGLRVRVKYGLPWDKLYRAEFLKGNEFLFDEDIHSFEDYLFNFRALGRARLILLSTDFGYHYRQWMESIGHSFNSNKPKLNDEFISKLYERAAEYGMSEKTRDGINSAVLSAIAVALNCYYFHPENTKSYAEIYKELNEMIDKTYYHEAIYSHSNRYLTARQMILKYALRLKRGGVLRALHKAKQKLKS